MDTMKDDTMCLFDPLRTLMDNSLETYKNNCH